MTTSDHPAAPAPAEDALRAACHGEPALPARLAPWMRELLADPERCVRLLDEHGSPVNVHDLSALPVNAAELVDTAHARGVRLRVFVARKANKSLALVDAVREAGLGLDVGSERELAQALDRGNAPGDIVLTAAVKPRRLLDLALGSGTTLILDNLDEAATALGVAHALADREHASPASRDGGDAPSGGLAAGADAVPGHPVGLRLAPTPGGPVVPTRFGEAASTWARWAGELGADGPLRIDGVHFHLHGYAASARAAALAEALDLVDALRALGHPVGFVDIGGGIPMSYLDDEGPWLAFWREHGRALRGEREPVTWRGDGLGLRLLDAGAEEPSSDPAGPWARVREAAGPGLTGTPGVYPYHQGPVRGAWLAGVLDATLPGGRTVAEGLAARGLELRCEPGRAMLDGCGMTLARVVHRTATSDGIDLVALAMNRTQCRSTSADFLVDPVLVRPSDAGEASGPVDAYLVGAYCIEDELILRRRIRFPRGVAVGDVIALPNTAGYLMHILESASHQIPLAATVVRAADGTLVRDDIDGV